MDTRSKIIDGAAELFRKFGIKAVTMDMIAAHLSISKRTIYEIFSDKDELLAGVLSEMARKQKELGTKVLEESGNTIEAIFRLIEINLDHLQTMSPGFNEDMQRFYQNIKMRKEIKCEMPDYKNNQHIIKRGVKEKLFRKEINVDIVNRTLFSMVFNIMNFELYPFEIFSRREVIKNTVINYLRGIATPEGLEIIQKLEKKI